MDGSFLSIVKYLIKQYFVRMLYLVKQIIYSTKNIEINTTTIARASLGFRSDSPKTVGFVNLQILFAVVHLITFTTHVNVLWLIVVTAATRGNSSAG